MTVELRVSYTTSGNFNTGTITHNKAYTTFTGLTIGREWEERLCRSEVTSSGKDIYAMATGEVVTCFLVEDFIEISRTAVSLEGYCSAVR